MVEESTRAALADILTHQFREKKERKESKKKTPPALPTIKEIEEAFALYFDGAFRKKEGKAAAGLVILNPASEKVMERGVVLLNVSSNNEAEYEALLKGLEWCVANGISCLDVYGDSMLIVSNKCRAFGLAKVISFL